MVTPNARFPILSDHDLTTVSTTVLYCDTMCSVWRNKYDDDDETARFCQYSTERFKRDKLQWFCNSG